MASSSVTAARRVVENFRTKEITSRSAQRRRFGPLFPKEPKTRYPETFHLSNPFLPRLNPKTKRWADPRYSLRQQADLVKKAKAAGLLHLLPPGPKTPILDPSHEKVKTYNPRYAAIASEAFKPRAQGEPQQPTLPLKMNKDWMAGEVHKTKDRIWSFPVAWHGKVDLKVKAGTELGVKLYAGKKRMFKGHKWERVKDARDRKREILLRGMSRRVENYKNYYKKRRPNPLKPPRTVKSPKLPF